MIPQKPEDCAECEDMVEYDPVKDPGQHCYMFRDFPKGCMRYRKQGEPRPKTLVEKCPKLLPLVGIAMAVDLDFPETLNKIFEGVHQHK